MRLPSPQRVASAALTSSTEVLASGQRGHWFLVETPPIYLKAAGNAGILRLGRNAPKTRARRTSLWMTTV